jgi:hypothetical protein
VETIEVARATRVLSERIELEEQLSHAGSPGHLAVGRPRSGCYPTRPPTWEITVEPIHLVETAHEVRATRGLESRHPFPERLLQDYNHLLQVLDAAAASNRLFCLEPYRILLVVEESS